MKELFINIVNWIFDPHTMSLPGWAWIVIPIIAGLIIWFLFMMFVGGIMEYILGGLFR